MDYILLHHTLLALDRLKLWSSRRVGTVLVGIVALLAIILGLVLKQVSAVATHSGLLLSFVLADALLLSSLPRRGLSFGPIQPPLVSLAVVRWLVSLLCALLGLWLGLSVSVICSVLVHTGILLVSVYACVYEANRVTLTNLVLHNDKCAGMPRPLQIVHLTDLHMERPTRRDERVLRMVEELEPDLILITGDYLNLSYATDHAATVHAREWLARLSAPLGVYAVLGTPEVDVRSQTDDVFKQTGVTLLRNETIQIHWGDALVALVGVTCERDLEVDSTSLERLMATVEPGAFTILLYHTPDLMPEAVDAEIDLYLAGHTHGGQWRLPLYGAIVTSSEYGKRYEMGHYAEGGTDLYVSRGLGMEGLSAPRARLLCPPEVVAVSLESPASG